MSLLKNITRMSILEAILNAIFLTIFVGMCLSVIMFVMFIQHFALEGQWLYATGCLVGFVICLAVVLWTRDNVL